MNTVEFCSPPTLEELIGALNEHMAELGASGVLNDGNDTALLAILANIGKSVSNDRPNAIVLLEAFIHQVSGFINGGILTVEEGQPLIDAAQAVIDQLNG
ncbi:MAG: hypothetical protein O7I93_08455 [Gemmatimonadetes bacterium]|nr:hypothetical protein [Gemmatimonadota bacterium]